jgi:hypothetical protein
VKAPFSCPNSSDSRSASGIAAQLTLTNGFWARFERAWTWRASTSLPEPLSPVISTEASERATCSERRTTFSIDGSRQTKLRPSAATASRTAAMRSASGGSGMYSRAPAWIAATAARASVPVPQATTGARMRSASSAATSAATSRATSTMTRSEPLARSTERPCSMPSAWVTAAPRLIAILEATINSPLRRPRMRSLTVPAP